MIFPRKSSGRLATMGASNRAISFALGGWFAARYCGGAGAGATDDAAIGGGGTAATTGRVTGAGGASIRRRMPRSKPANFDLTMFDMTFVI